MKLNNVALELLLLLTLLKVYVFLAVSPIQPATKNPYYFQSYYKKLVSSTYSLPSYTNLAYPYDIPLTVPRSNVQQTAIALSSYESQAVGYFGFSFTISCPGNPCTQANVIFQPLINNVFTIIGFCNIIITTPFDSFITFLEYNLDTQLTEYVLPYTVPLSYDKYVVIKSFNAFSTSAGSNLGIGIGSTVYSATDQVGVSFDSTPDDLTNGVDFSVQLYVIMIDKTKKGTLSEFNLLSWDYYKVYTNPFGSSNFGISTAKYSSNFNGRCIIGEQYIDDFNYNKPYFKFDLDPVLGVINGQQNSVHHWIDIRNLCFKNMICPAGYQFKKLSVTMSCHNCAEGLVIPYLGTITDCLVEDLTVNKIQYNQADGTKLNRCAKCIDCEDHYFADNGICKLCSDKWSHCVTCNEQVQCLTCVVTRALSASGVCLLCSVFMTNCLQCLSNTACQTCQVQYYLDAGNTPQCNLCNIIPNCLQCSSDTVCTKCLDGNALMPDGSACVDCGTINPKCKTCSAVPLVCSACDAGYFLVAAPNDCFQCSSFLDGCIQCTNAATCTKCQQNDRYLLNLGSKKCISCSTFMDNCLECLSPTVCTKCQGQFVVDPNDATRCICPFGWQLTATCNQITGCISSHYSSNNQKKCFACNSDNNFMYILSPGNCTCKRGYYLDRSNLNKQFQKCKVICGDGLYVEQYCDDGNLQSGDGCSPQCQIQDHWKCLSVRYQTSICKFQIISSKLEVNVYSLSRGLSTNSLILKVIFKPQPSYEKYLNAQELNSWDQNFIKVNSTKISFVSRSFEQSNILAIQFKIHQHESIQGQLFKWTLAYDSNRFVPIPPYELTVLMKGQNSPLVYERQYFHQLPVTICSYVLGGCAFVLAIVSMVKAQSNIAFEMVTTVGFIYYSRLLIYNLNTPILYALNGLRICSGWNQFFYQEHIGYVQFVSKNRFHITSELGLMTIFTLGVVSIVLGIKAIFQIKSIYALMFSESLERKLLSKKGEQQNQLFSKMLQQNQGNDDNLVQEIKKNRNKKKENLAKEQKQLIFYKQYRKSFSMYKRFQKQFAVPIILMSFFTIFAAYTGFQNEGQKYETYFPSYITSLIILVYFVILIYYIVGVSSSILAKAFTHQSIKADSTKKLNVMSPSTNKLIQLNFSQSQQGKDSDYVDLLSFKLFLVSIVMFFTIDYASQQHILQYLTEICFGIYLVYLLVFLVKTNPYKESKRMLLHTITLFYHQLIKILFLVFLWVLQHQELTLSKINLDRDIFILISVYSFLVSIALMIIFNVFRVKYTWNNTQNQKISQKQEYQELIKYKEKLFKNKVDDGKGVNNDRDRNKNKNGEKKRKYVKNDEDNMFRYQNIFNREKQEENKKNQKTIQRQKSNRKKNKEAQFHEFINQSLINSSIEANNFSATRSGALSANKQPKNIRHSFLPTNSITSQNLQHSLDSKLGQKQYLKQIKSQLKQSFQKMKEQKQKSIHAKNSSATKAHMSMQEYEDQLQRKYEYNQWRLRNPQKARAEDQIKSKSRKKP